MDSSEREMDPELRKVIFRRSRIYSSISPNILFAGVYREGSFHQTDLVFTPTATKFDFLKAYKNFWTWKFEHSVVLSEGPINFLASFYFKNSPFFWRKGALDFPNKQGVRVDAVDLENFASTSLFYSSGKVPLTPGTSRNRYGLRLTDHISPRKYYLFVENNRTKVEKSGPFQESRRLRFKIKREFWSDSEATDFPKRPQVTVVHDLFSRGKPDWHAKIKNISIQGKLPSVSGWSFNATGFTTISNCGKSQAYEAYLKDWLAAPQPSNQRVVIEQVANLTVNPPLSVTIGATGIGLSPFLFGSAVSRNLDLTHLSYGPGIRLTTTKSANFQSTGLTLDLFYDLQSQGLGFKLIGPNKCY